MDLTERQAALLAGISLLLMAVVAGYSYGYAYGSLVIAHDANATYENIQASTGLFTGGVIGWVVIFILDLLVAWGLYRFFLNKNPSLSLNTAILRVVYTLFLGFAIWNLIQVLPLIDGAEVNPEVIERLHSFTSIWNYGLIIFGIHLLGLGMMAIRAEKMLRYLGFLLVFAGICYSGLSTAKALAPGYADEVATAEMILSLPMALAEVLLAIWLIVKGGKVSS